MQYEKIQQEIQNYLNFIKIGNLSKAVSEALTDAERRNEELKQEVESLEFQKENSFKAPSKEWINHRLKNLRETLNKNTASSSLALKELLAPINLEPVLTKERDFYQLFSGDERNFKPYYVAHSKIQTLALLDERYQNSGTVPVAPMVRIGIIGGVLMIVFECFLTHRYCNLYYLSIGTAAWAAPVFPMHRSALLGQSLTWRPAGAGLLANAMRVRLGFAACKAYLKLRGKPQASEL